jgi:uncharacterized membrane protein YkvA (DUF1232 family)
MCAHGEGWEIMARRNLGRLDLGVIERLRLGWRLLRDPRIPAWPKVLVPLAAIYVISPVDGLPDIIPLLGWVDDASVIGLILAVIAMLVRWSPQEVVAEHAANLGFAPGFEGVTPERGEPFRGTKAGKQQQEPIEATYWVDDWR